MNTYCLVCRKNTENKDTKIIKTKNGRLQMRSYCSIYGNKKSRFIKNTWVKYFALIHSNYKNEQS